MLYASHFTINRWRKLLSSTRLLEQTRMMSRRRQRQGWYTKPSSMYLSTVSLILMFASSDVQRWWLRWIRKCNISLFFCGQTELINEKYWENLNVLETGLFHRQQQILTVVQAQICLDFYLFFWKFQIFFFGQPLLISWSIFFVSEVLSALPGLFFVYCGPLCAVRCCNLVWAVR